MNCIDFNMNIRQSIEMPRFHDQWLPDKIFYERFAFSKDVKDALAKMGYKLGDQTVLGKAEGIMIDPATGIKYGAADPRGNGAAEGY